MTTDAEIVVSIRGDVSGGRTVKRSLDDIERSGRKATTSTALLDKQVKRTARSYDGLKSAVIGFFSLAAGRQMLQAIDNITLLEARIENSTRNLDEFTVAYERLIGIAKDTGSELATSVEVFQRLSFVRDEIDATVDEMLLFTDSVQKLGVVSGASTQNLNAGLKQLGQSLSSPILRAEEFNSIMENIPAVGVAIAGELGVTTGQMRQLVIAGELLSKDVFAAILNQTDNINTQFDKFPVTIGRAFNELLIDLQTAGKEFDTMSSSTEILITALGVVGDLIGVLGGLIKGFGNVVKATFTIVASQILAVFDKIILGVQEAINIAIKGINLIKSEELELLDFAPDIGAGNIVIGGLETAEKELKEAADGFKKAFESSVDIFTPDDITVLEQVNEKTREISKNYGAIADELVKNDINAEKVTDQIKELNKVSDSLANSFVNAFEKFTDGTLSAKDAIASLLKDVQKMIFDQGVRKPLGGLLSSVIGGVIGGFGTENFGRTATGSAGIPTAKPKFASGGSMILGGAGGIDNNTLSLNGAPIASVGRGEVLSISPDQKGGGAGITINQVINVSTGVVDTVRNEMVAFLPEIQKSTQAAINEATLRSIR